MAQLRLQHSEFLALNTEIYVISFGPEHWARVWQEETEVPLTLLLDPERAAYRAYGLERSIFRSWGPKIFLRYARLMLAGRRWRGIKGDSGQLGGDFIVDASGVVRLAYPSRDPTDRPPVEQLLAVFQEIGS